MKPTLTIGDLCAEAAKFAEIESLYDEPALYGVTDGKAIAPESRLLDNLKCAAIETTIQPSYSTSWQYFRNI